MRKPFISLVVPTYNRANLISRTLRSLQDQSADNYEIIIVDDGSTDNTAEVVRPFLNDTTTYHLKKNAERAAARNYGAALAKGDYVNFFDSDDIALPNHVHTATILIQKNDDPEWFHLGFAWADPDGKVFKKVDNYAGNTLNDTMHKGNLLSCNGVFVRKDIIMEHRFNEDRALSASEDYELWLRLTARYPLYYTNEITSLVIDHESRSVRKINGETLIRRLELLLYYLAQDAVVMKFLGSKFGSIKMDSNSYIALHLSELKEYKVKSINYLFRALFNSPALLFQRRFLAIIKHLVLQW